MDPPTADDQERRRPPPPTRRSRSPPPPHNNNNNNSPRRGIAVVGPRRRYIALLIVLSFICFPTFLTYQRILLSQLYNNHDDDDDVTTNAHHQLMMPSNNKFVSFQPTAFYKHVQLRKQFFTPTTTTTLFEFGTGTNEHSNDDVRISFQLHDPKVVPLQSLFNKHMTCPLGMIFQGKRRREPTKQVRSGILPHSLTRVTNTQQKSSNNDHEYPIREGRVLDFTATISTNLKILHIGDSVGVQLAQAFDEMVGCRNNVTSANNGTGFCHPRFLFWEAWKGHEGRTIIAPVVGGGVSAMWR